MARGKFITFEGGEGAGKSTQLDHLAAALERAQIPLVKTREPGGCPGAEQIRELLIHGPVERWDPLTEALLHFAARREHLEQLVLPTLARGVWVLSDRFADSTMAYQGYGHELGRAAIETLYELVVGARRPDLTLILDVPLDLGLERAKARGSGGDRYERMDRAFHERLRQGFRAIAAAEPKRCVLIDAGQAIEPVQAAVRDALTERLKVELS